MAVDLGCSSLLDTVLTHGHDAVTIARRACIGAYIVDAPIIAATPAAAAWYGVEDPQQLVGRWLSVVHHPDDARLGRVLSLARYYGVPVPTTYVSRIRQLHAPPTFRMVLKDTTQMTMGNETYWITKLREPQGPPLATQLDIAQAFPLPEGEQALRFCGYMSVADVDQLLQERPLVDVLGAGQGRWRRRPRRAESPAVRHGPPPSQTVPAPGLSLGQTLRQAREAQGLSLRQVAAQIHHEDGTPITAQHLAYLEQDRRKPRLRFLLALAQLFALEPLAMLVRAHLGPAVVAEYLQAYPAQQAAVIQLFLEAKAQRFAFTDWEHVHQQLAALRHPVFRRSTPRSP